MKNLLMDNPICTHPDVLILGGGAAGVAAAVGASEAGAAVVLVEKNGFLGGKATAAYVGTICGLYYRSEDPIARFATEGFAKTFALYVQKASRTQAVFYKNGLHFLPYERWAFLQGCDEWAKKSTQSLCLHTFVHHMQTVENRIVSVQASVYNAPVTFFPKAVVDTSGEAVAARLLNFPVLQSNDYQAAAQVFSLTNLKAVDAQTLSLSLMRTLRKGQESGALPEGGGQLSIVPGTVHDGTALFKLGLSLPITNELNQATTLEMTARKLVVDVVSFLKTNCDLFQNVRIGMIAPEVGIRTGPRQEGKYILQTSDVLTCKKFEHSIAKGTWPIEYWPPNKKVEMQYFALDDYYDIPATALESAHIHNLFFAGRHLSATEEAIASARVIGTCLMTGYAAGKLAANFCLQ